MKNYPACKEINERMELANEAGSLMFALSLHLHPFNSVACLVILYAFLSYADFF